MTELIRITRGDNPYHREVQGKANEPICVAGILDRAKLLLKLRDLDYSLAEIVNRLDAAERRCTFRVLDARFVRRHSAVRRGDV